MTLNSRLVPSARSVVAMSAAMLAAAAGYSAQSAAVTHITLPAETAQLQPSTLPGYASAQTYCMTCHSVDYVHMQPTMARGFWQAEVVKMQKTYGAPIPDAEVAPLVDYLTRTYGTEKSAAGTPAAAK